MTLNLEKLFSGEEDKPKKSGKPVKTAEEILFSPSDEAPESVNPTFGETSRYDQGFVVGGNLQATRATNQGWMQELGTGLAKAVLKVPFSVIGNVGSILDIEDYYNQDQEVGNWLTSLTEKAKQNIDEAAPIYRKNPGKALDIGDSAWWNENGSGLVESIGSFALTGYGLGSGAGKLLSAFKAGKTAQAGNVLLNAVALNQAESIPQAMQVYQTTYQLQLKKGKTDEEAKQIAADAAAYSVNINRLNIPLNLTSSMAFLRTPQVSRQLLENVSKRNTLKHLFSEGAQEYAEETINLIGEKEGLRRGEGKGFSLDNVIHDVFSAEGVEAGVLGFLGGAGQTLVTSGLDAATGVAAEKKARYLTQQNYLNQLEELTKPHGVPTLKKVLEGLRTQAPLLNQIDEAVKAGRNEEAEKTSLELLGNQALEAFQNGAGGQFRELYKNIQTDPAATEKFGADIHQQVSKALDHLDHLENIYNKFSELPNLKEIMQNRIQRRFLGDQIRSVNKAKQAAYAEYSKDAEEMGYQGAVLGNDEESKSLLSYQTYQELENKSQALTQQARQTEAELNLLTSPQYLQAYAQKQTEEGSQETQNSSQAEPSATQGETESPQPEQQLQPNLEGDNGDIDTQIAKRADARKTVKPSQETEVQGYQVTDAKGNTVTAVPRNGKVNMFADGRKTANFGIDKLLKEYTFPEMEGKTVSLEGKEYRVGEDGKVIIPTGSTPEKGEPTPTTKNTLSKKKETASEPEPTVKNTLSKKASPYATASAVKDGDTVWQLRGDKTIPEAKVVHVSGTGKLDVNGSLYTPEGFDQAGYFLTEADARKAMPTQETEIPVTNPAPMLESEEELFPTQTIASDLRITYRHETPAGKITPQGTVELDETSVDIDSLEGLQIGDAIEIRPSFYTSKGGFTRVELKDLKATDALIAQKHLNLEVFTPDGKRLGALPVSSLQGMRPRILEAYRKGQTSFPVKVQERSPGIPNHIYHYQEGLTTQQIKESKRPFDLRDYRNSLSEVSQKSTLVFGGQNGTLKINAPLNNAGKQHYDLSNPENYSGRILNRTDFIKAGAVYASVETSIKDANGEPKLFLTRGIPNRILSSFPGGVEYVLSRLEKMLASKDKKEQSDLRREIDEVLTFLTPETEGEFSVKGNAIGLSFKDKTLWIGKTPFAFKDFASKKAEISKALEGIKRTVLYTRTNQLDPYTDPITKKDYPSYQAFLNTEKVIAFNLAKIEERQFIQPGVVVSTPVLQTDTLDSLPPSMGYPEEEIKEVSINKEIIEKQLTEEREKREFLEQAKKDLVRKTRKPGPKTRLASTESQRSNPEKELAWFRRVFGKEADIRVVQGLIRVGQNLAWGTFENDVTTLSDVAAPGTVYHEAFHRAFGLFLSESAQARLLDGYRRTNPKLAKASDEALEERMAEDFREYVQQKETQRPLPFLTRFFQNLYFLIKKNVFRTLSANEFFAHIHRGGYANQQSKSTTKGVKTRLPEGLTDVETYDFLDSLVGFYLQLAPQYDPTHPIRKGYRNLKNVFSLALETYQESEDANSSKLFALTNGEEILLDKARKILFDKFGIRESESLVDTQSLNEVSEEAQIQQLEAMTNQEGGWNASFAAQSNYDKASQKLKQLIASLYQPDGKDIDPDTGYAYTGFNRWGMEKYVDFDDAWKFLTRNLAGIHSKKEMLEEVRNLANYRPEYLQLHQILTKEGENSLLTTQFFVVFNTYKLPYSLLRFTEVDAKGRTEAQYKLKNSDGNFTPTASRYEFISSDRSGVETTLTTAWKAKAESMAAKGEGIFHPGDTLGVNKEKASALLESYQTVLAGYAESSKPTFDWKGFAQDLEDILSQAGIGLESESILEEKENLGKRAIDKLVQKNSPSGIYRLLQTFSEGINALEDESTSVAKLARVQGKRERDHVENSFRNFEGNTVYSYNLAYPLTRIFQRLTGKDYETETANLQKDPTYVNSYLLRLLEHDEFRKDKFKFILLDGLKEDKYKEKGVSYGDFSRVQLERAKLGAFLNHNGSGYANAGLGLRAADKLGLYSVHTPSDSSTLAFVQMPVLREKQLKEQLLTLWQQEQTRIEEVRNLIAGVQNATGEKRKELEAQLVDTYHFKYDAKTDSKDFSKAMGLKYLQYPELENATSFNRIHQGKYTFEQYTEAVKNNNTELLSEILYNRFAFKGEQYRDYLKSNDITADSSYLDQQAIKERFGNFDDFLRSYLSNKFLVNAELQKIALGNQAFWGDNAKMNKRAKLILSPFKTPDLSQTGDHYHLGIAEDVEVGSLVHDSLVKGFENLGLKGEFLKEYQAGINVADAQGFLTLQEAIKVLKGLGKYYTNFEFTPLGQTLTQYEKMQKGEATDPEAELMIQPFKSIAVGIQTLPIPSFRNGEEKESFLNTVQFLKNSQVVLLPAFTKGTPLDELRTWMETEMEEGGSKRQRSPHFVMKSGHKGGTKGAASIVVEKEGKQFLDFTKLANITPVKRDYRDYGIQLEIPEHRLDAQNRLGSQTQKLVLVDLPDDTPVGNRSGKEVKEEYLHLLSQNVAESFASLQGEVAQDGQIRDLLLDQLELTDNSEEGFNLDAQGNFRFPLWMNAELTRKIESTLNGLFKNRVVRQKMKGGSYVQVSALGVTQARSLKDLSKDQQAGINWLNGKEGKLNFYDIQDGKPQRMEVLLPSWSREFIKEDVDINDLDPTLLDMIGYRIPTQGKNSILAMKVVGFLPKEMGSAIVLPEEITKLTGSDFDIDKLYVMTPHHRKKDGKFVKVAGGTESREARENRIQEIMSEILLNPSTFADSVMPLDGQDYREVANTISAITGNDGNYDGAFDDELVQSQMAQTNQVGIKLTGSYANANANRPLAQMTGLKMVKSAFRFNGVQLDGNLDKLLSVSGKPISSYISQYLSASVDNAKELIHGLVNNNLFTANTIILLTEAGLDIKTVFNFIAQPGIIRVYERSERAKGTEEQYEDHLKLTAEEYLHTLGRNPKEAEDVLKNPETTDLTDSDMQFFMLASQFLADNPENATKTAFKEWVEKARTQVSAYLNVDTLLDRDFTNLPKQYAEFQLRVLQNFAAYQQAAKERALIIRTQKVDVYDGSSSASLDKIRNDYQKLQELQATGENYFSYDESQWPLMQQLRKALFLPTEGMNAVDLLAKYVPFGTSVWQKAKERISELTGKKGDFSEDLINTLNYELLTLSLAGNAENPNPIFEGKSTQEIIQHLLYGDNSIAQRLENLKKDPSLRQNLFLQQLQPQIKKGGSNGLTFRSGTRSLLTENRLIDSLESLMNHPDAEVKRFGKDLVLYAYLNKGFQFGPNSYFRYFSFDKVLNRPWKRDGISYADFTKHLGNQIQSDSFSFADHHLEQVLRNNLFAPGLLQTFEELSITPSKKGTFGINLNKHPEVKDLTYFRTLDKEGNPVVMKKIGETEGFGEYEILEPLGKSRTRAGEAVKEYDFRELPKSLVNNKEYRVKFNGSTATKETVSLQKEAGMGASNQTLEPLMEKLAERFNVHYQIIHEPTQQWAGKFQNGVATINTAYAGLDTPFHEIAHPFVDVLEKENPTLFNNLIRQITAEEKTLTRTRERYPELEGVDLLKEAIVQSIGEYAAKASQPQGLVTAIKQFFRRIGQYIREFFKGELHPGTTLEELGSFLANGKKKIDLSTSEAEGYQKVDENLEETVKEQVTKLEARKKYFEELKGNKGFSPRQEGINKLEELLFHLGENVSKGEFKEAFKALVRNAEADMTKITAYLDNESNVGKDDFIANVLEFRNYIETYRGLAQPRFGENINGLLDNLNYAQERIEDRIKDHIAAQVKNYSGKAFTEEELKTLLRESADINWGDAYLGDTATSPDTLLALANKLFKEAKQKVMDAKERFVEEAKTMGNKLAQANGGKADYSFMVDKTTGRYLERTKKELWETMRKFKESLKDGLDKREYKPVTTLAGADPKDLAHNLDLQKKKKAYTAFRSPEKVDATGAHDGDNFRYSAAFKAERSRFETLSKTQEGLWEWTPKPGIDPTEYRQYRSKYYAPEVETWVAVKDEVKEGRKTIWKHLGRVELRKMRFVKGEYIEPTDHWNSDAYQHLMNPTTELGKAQKEYYQWFTTSFTDLLEKLDSQTAWKMKGRLPVVLKHFTAQVSSSADKLGVVSRQLKNFITPDTYTSTRTLDENGFVKDDVPVFYTTKLRNQRTIDVLEAKRNALDPTAADYKGQMDKLNRQIRVETSRPEATDLNYDLTESLSKFAEMAQNYEIMKEVESTVLAIGEVIENRKYLELDAKGEPQRDRQGNLIYKEGSKSKAAERFEAWMKMTFYGQSSVDDSLIGTVAKRFMAFNSLLRVGGLKFIPAVNNYVMGRINQSIEAYGGTLYSKESAMKAVKSFNLEYMPGLFTEMRHSTQGPYKEHRPASKYSALVKRFRFVKGQGSEDGTQKGLLDWSYALQEGGEFANQSKVGIAILMDEQLTHPVTGEKRSIYDAYAFDPATGALKLVDGFTLPDKERHRITNKILETNKQIHGNYASEDKAMIQQHWLGELAMQFHKWVYPMYKSRFKPKYFVEGVDTELEGRYLTLYNFFKYSKGLQHAFSTRYSELSLLEKQNMRKNMTELAFFFASFALYGLFNALSEGIDDEDAYTKTAVNFLAMQNSRQMKEIMTFVPGVGIREQFDLIKSPISLMTTLKEGGELVGTVAGVPYNYAYDEQELYFQRGIHKGDLRLWKETKDVLPFLGQLNQFDNLINQSDFYIR